MCWRRAVILLAMLAALAVAPSSVVGAPPPKELFGASVTPSAGTTMTAFMLSINYRSSTGNQAIGVTATVAGKSVDLSLASGTALDGTWTGSTTLPAGSWTVTFQANTSKGRQPSASFGPVSVGVPVTPPPSTPTSGEAPTDATEPGAVITTAAPNPQPTTKLSPSAAAAGASSAAHPSSAPAPASTDGAAPRSLGPAGAPRGRTAGAHASSSPAGAAASGQAAAAEPSPSGQAGSGALVDMVLLLGVVGVAAVALLGAAWIVMARRRDRAEPSIAVAASVEPAIHSITTVEQRARRRARLRPSDDPILAALGLHDEQPSPPESETEPGSAARRSRRAPRTPRADS